MRYLRAGSSTDASMGKRPRKRVGALPMLLTHHSRFIHVQQTIMAKNALLLMYSLETPEWTLLRPGKQPSQAIALVCPPTSTQVRH